jgi:hypothetical protein
MTMALVDRRIGRQAIQVFLPLDVPDPRALRLGDDDVKRFIVVSVVLIL